VFDSARSDKHCRDIFTTQLLRSPGTIFEHNRRRNCDHVLASFRRQGLVDHSTGLDPYAHQGIQPLQDATKFSAWVSERQIKIRHIDLVSWTNVTDTTLDMLSRHGTLLDSLTVSRCETISDTGISHLAEGCRGLRELHINATASLTQALTCSLTTATSSSSWTLHFAVRSPPLDLDT
jgi:hypothetical protein